MTTTLKTRPVRARITALVLLVTAMLAVLIPSAASAHSLDSSTISTRVGDDGVDATLTIAFETLEEAMGTTYTSDQNVDEYADEITDYLADHLSVTSADGTEWGESVANVTRETVEGIDSLSVDVTFDTSGSDTSRFEIAYDAVIEAVPDHEAVVIVAGRWQPRTGMRPSAVAAADSPPRHGGGGGDRPVRAAT